jgi:DNA-binding MarR family transcriptional regulator
MDAASLHFLGRKLVMLAERAIAAPEGMPPFPTAEMLVLRAVLERPGVTVTDLVAQLAIAQSRISQVVATLEGAGLVQRFTDAGDRRRQRIEPTKKVKEELEQRLSREVNDALDPLFVGVSAREKARILSALSRLHDLIREADEREGMEEAESSLWRAAAPPARAGRE